MERRPLHQFVVKVASRCNLNCSYCFVYNRADQRYREQPKLMDARTAQRLFQRVREHCVEHNKLYTSVIFHGGEPLLGGVKHLYMLLDHIQTELVDHGITVNVGMQSNGILFTDKIGDALLGKNVTIGVSIDGPPEINDRNRVDHKGRGSSADLESAMRLLTSDKYRSLFSGFLCVIDPTANPLDVYRYIASWKPPGVDLLLPLDNYDQRPHGKSESLDRTDYADWLIAVFDEWYREPNPTPIRFFESIIRSAIGLNSMVESVGTHPVDIIVVETNGDIEGVDSLKATFNGATVLGFNVFDNSFTDVIDHPAVISRQRGASSLCDECQSCSIVDICGAGYLPHRYSSSNGFLNPSVYCADLRKLIAHIMMTVRGDLSAIGLDAPTASLPVFPVGHVLGASGPAPAKSSVTPVSVSAKSKAVST